MKKKVNPRMKRSDVQYFHNPWVNEIYPKKLSRPTKAVMVLALLGLAAFVLVIVLAWTVSW